MRIRSLDSGGEEAPLLFDGEMPEGWFTVGDARYRVEGTTLIGGAGPARRQRFLVSRREYGDFAFEVDVRIAVEGNSGIQLRSHVGRDGRLRGYQAEIDPSPRAWSAGLFDEGRRGWLDDLSDNEAAREAFDLDGWNRYRIVANGPKLEHWINGQRTVLVEDNAKQAAAKGIFALQIHGGPPMVVKARKIRLKRLDPKSQP